MVWRLNCPLLLQVHERTVVLLGNLSSSPQTEFGVQSLLLVGAGAVCVVMPPGNPPCGQGLITARSSPRSGLCQPRVWLHWATRESLGHSWSWLGTAKLPVRFGEGQPCSYVSGETIIEKEKNGFWFFFLQSPTPEAVTVYCASSCPQVRGISGQMWNRGVPNLALAWSFVTVKTREITFFFLSGSRTALCHHHLVTITQTSDFKAFRERKSVSSRSQGKGGFSSSKLWQFGSICQILP